MRDPTLKILDPDQSVEFVAVISSVSVVCMEYNSAGPCAS